MTHVFVTQIKKRSTPLWASNGWDRSNWTYSRFASLDERLLKKPTLWISIKFMIVDCVIPFNKSLAITLFRQIDFSQICFEINRVCIRNSGSKLKCNLHAKKCMLINHVNLKAIQPLSLDLTRLFCVFFGMKKSRW